MADRVLIRFLGPYKQWGPGDVAAFSPEVAEQILGSRVTVTSTANGMTVEEPKPLAVRVSEEEARRIGERRAAKSVPPARVAIRFRVAYGKWAPGDVAGFDADTAARLTTTRRSAGRILPPIADRVDQGPAIPRDLDSLTYPELKSLAAALGLDASGKKAELVARVEAHRGTGRIAPAAAVPERSPEALDKERVDR